MIRKYSMLFVLLLSTAGTLAFAQNPKDRFLSSIKNLMEIESIPYQEQPDEEVLEEILDNVRSELRDPESAKFQDVTLTRQEGQVYACGKVNAKNAFGGYTGFKWFFATPISIFHTEQDRTGQMAIVHFCQ